jgi:hypothetical protein
VLRAKNLSCDNVDSYTPLGQTEDSGWDAYLARCRDGGRYVYFESRPKGQIFAATRKDEAFHFSYRCPE